MACYHSVCVPVTLKPYLRGIWIQDSADLPNDGLPYRILPQPFPVLGFQYRGRLSVIRESREELLACGGVTGLQSTFRHFQSHSDARTILIAFQPYGAYPLLGCDMDETADRHVSLEDLVGAPLSSRTEERLAEARTSSERAAAVQSFVQALVDRSVFSPHPAIVQATTALLKTHGQLRIDALADDLSISRRQLERLFLKQVGVTPKSFASLAQYRLALNLLQQRRNYADAACEAGYADQSHFIRSFTQRTGVTPGGYQSSLEVHDVAF